MPNSKSKPLTRLKAKIKWPEAAMIVLATIGLFDATLLTLEHYADLNLPCTVTHGCQVVLASKYAEIFGVPVAIFGVVYYLVILIMSFYAYQNATDRKWLLALSSLGFLSTLYLIYIQAHLLHAWCQYCLLSALTSTLLFILNVILYVNQRKVKGNIHGNKT